MITIFERTFYNGKQMLYFYLLYICVNLPGTAECMCSCRLHIPWYQGSCFKNMACLCMALH